MYIYRLRRTAFSVAVLLVLLLSGCRLFLNYYTLSLSVEGDIGGSITVEPNRSVYRENSIVSLAAVADPGWNFKSWSGVTTDDVMEATVQMDMNRMVSAEFEPALTLNNPTDDMINPPSFDFAPAAGDRWTFMVYLDADNSLDPYAIADFNEIEKGFAEANNDYLNIYVLLDRYEGGCSVYKIQNDSSDGIDSLPLYPIIDGKTMSAEAETELNLGKPDVLTDFVKYCVAEQTAEHYALMFWNHGGGARSLPAEVSEPVLESRLICADENPGDGRSVDYLFAEEVQQALNAVVSDAPLPGGFDVISLDACIMGTVEAAYELRDLSSCYVASMSNVAASGWDYEELFSHMSPAISSSDAESLSILMVDSFRNSMSTIPEQSISAVRTSGLSNLKSRIDSLSAALYQADRQETIEYIRDAAIDFFNDDYEAEVIAQPYHDLNDFCWLLINNEKYLSVTVTAAAKTVLDVLGDVVIAAYAGPGLGNYYGTGAQLQRGLSIFFSKGNLLSGTASQYAKQYWYTSLDSGYFGPMGFLDFCTSDTDGIVESWREMHEAWYDPYKPEGYTPGSW